MENFRFRDGRRSGTMAPGQSGRKAFSRISSLSMNPSIPNFKQWLESLPQADGFLQISPTRAYMHAEENYDAQYGVDAPKPEEGRGLCALLSRNGLDCGGPALEIGCGTGHLTTGLALEYPGTSLLVTDPSPAFLEMTRRRISTTISSKASVDYAILNGDDVSLLPARSFSLIALRSTLHHILDVERFIGACAESLLPGGTLAMGAEPCESGYVLMGAIAQSIPQAFRAGGTTLPLDWQEQLQNFGDTMRFYCRRDLDKSSSEDKHLFRVHEIAEIGNRHGLRQRYFGNAAFADFDGRFEPYSRLQFSKFFIDYLRYCMSFDPEFVKQISIHLETQLAYVDDCYASHAGPLFRGVFLLTKEGSQS
jgi:SAM-dependent methyltransferase